MAKVDPNRNKTEQLGMSIGTASGRLRKMIMFRLIQRLGEDICYRCNEKIGSSDELSVEHKIAWMYRSADLFWDLENIAFSHHRCNIGEAWRGRKAATNIRGSAPDGFAWCGTHQDWLPVGRFHRDSSKPTGLCDYCKDCKSGINAKRNRKNGAGVIAAP